MNAQDLSDFDLCERRFKWGRNYVPFRISLIGALYKGLHAGLIGQSPESDAKNAVMECAAFPGLDVDGRSYDLAVHLAHLAGIIATYLRGKDDPWKLVAPVNGWEPAVYEIDSRIRRVVLVDYWNDDRKAQECRSWRTVGEICSLDRPMLLNAISIGQSVNGRRVSHWTRAFAHPQNGKIRFAPKHGDRDKFSGSWEKVWRETSRIRSEEWLSVMQSDDAFADVVHAVQIPIPKRRDEYLLDIKRIGKEIDRLEYDPPMRRSGCYWFSKCIFADVCHGPEKRNPEQAGFLPVTSLTSQSATAR